MAMCNTYQVYGSRMGQETLDGTRTVSRQHMCGVLFKSQNGSTYTADQNEDLKFTMKKAVFTTNQTSTVTLANDSVDTRTLGSKQLEQQVVHKHLEYFIKIMVCIVHKQCYN